MRAFWLAAVAAVPELRADTPFQVWSFGDTAEICDHVLAETIAGRNRATASLRWSYDAEGAPLPKAGDVGLILDSGGRPGAVVVTRSVEIVAFDAVDEDFARAEGYHNDPLAEWRTVHWDFFSRRCAALGRVPSRDMPVACERFEMVYPAAR